MEKTPFTRSLFTLSLIVGFMQTGAQNQRLFHQDYTSFHQTSTLHSGSINNTANTSHENLTDINISVSSDSSIKNSVGAKIDLKKEAKLTASHHTTVWKIENAYDGDWTTQWIGEDQPLSWQPTNIIIEFNKPKTIQRVVLHSIKHRDMLAIKDFELFAWGKKSWA